ncbi:MAG: hypothetical protein EOP33_03100 [Rickettsiaceae bacterium]|nr:MAG: hypothetical protein EOP33_03100 [Rickettsiaceae bacterium]
MNDDNSRNDPDFSNATVENKFEKQDKQTATIDLAEPKFQEAVLSNVSVPPQKYTITKAQTGVEDEIKNTKPQQATTAVIDSAKPKFQEAVLSNVSVPPQKYTITKAQIGIEEAIKNIKPQQATTAVIDSAEPKFQEAVLSNVSVPPQKYTITKAQIGIEEVIKNTKPQQATLSKSTERSFTKRIVDIIVDLTRSIFAFTTSLVQSNKSKTQSQPQQLASEKTFVNNTIKTHEENTPEFTKPVTEGKHVTQESSRRKSPNPSSPGRN